MHTPGPGSYATLPFTTSDLASITRHIHNWAPSPCSPTASLPPVPGLPPQPLLPLWPLREPSAPPSSTPHSFISRVQLWSLDMPGAHTASGQPPWRSSVHPGPSWRRSCLCSLLFSQRGQEGARGGGREKHRGREGGEERIHSEHISAKRRSVSLSTPPALVFPVGRWAGGLPLTQTLETLRDSW